MELSHLNFSETPRGKLRGILKNLPSLDGRGLRGGQIEH